MSSSFKKFCPYPFSRIQLNGTHAFVPCCSFWLTDEYYKIAPGDNPWNGPQAIELRKRILNEDYSLCKRELCHVPLLSLDDMRRHANQIFNETPLMTTIIDTIEQGHPLMPSGPASLSIGGDRRCNLSCPTCRAHRITKLTDYQVKNINYIQSMIDRFYKNDIAVIKVSAEGEPFFSPWFRELLQHCHKTYFPKIQFINLLSNGTLLTPSNWEQLKPGILNVKEISISVDAGNASTYAKVRGFPWNKLVKNLEFVSDLRSQNAIQTFRLLFVVRKSNFESMEDFIHLGMRLGADVIHFSPLSHWPDTIIDYEDEAVFQENHPSHIAFMKMISKIISMNNPKIRLDIPNIEAHP